MKLFLIAAIIASFVAIHPAQAEKREIVKVYTFEPLLVTPKKQSLNKDDAATAQRNNEAANNLQIRTDAVKRMREIANAAAQERRNPSAAAEKANKEIQTIMADLRRRGLAKGITPPSCDVVYN